MPRPRRIDQALVAHAHQLVATATDLHQLRTAQAILLPALLGTSLEKTATLLGVGRATVPRLQAQLSAQVSDRPIARRSWGGRRQALLSVAAEQEFVSSWRTKAEAGELIVLSSMRAALEKQLGRKIAPEVFYRLVRRHQWRKVAPDTRHPKSDPVVQEEWKKNAAEVAGGRIETGAGTQATGAIVFSGRGPFWADGPLSPLLGSQPAASQGLQWLRTPIYLCVRVGQSVGWTFGLVPDLPDEHDGDEGVSSPSQRRARGGIYSDARRRSQFAHQQGLGNTRESAFDPAARLFPGIESAGARLG